MRDLIQGPDGFYPNRALPELGASDLDIASLSGTAAIAFSGTSGLSIRVALVGSAAFEVFIQADLGASGIVAIARGGGGIASTQPRLLQLNDPELARHRQALEDEELLAILETIAIYLYFHS